MNTKQLEQILQEIDLTPSEIAVFSAMLNGVLKVKDIMLLSGMKRPSVYYALNKLQTRGLIGRIQVGEYNQWKVTNLSSILAKLNDREASLAHLKEEAMVLVAEHEAGPTKTEHTTVTSYEGQKAIESVVFNSLYCKSKEILSIAPPGNFFQQTGSEFALRYVAERKRRGITTRHIWERPLDSDTMQTYYGKTTAIRYAPKTLAGKFKTTIFVYDDTVMYIGPQADSQAIVVNSPDHAAMQRAVFETIWGMAKPAPTK